MASASPAFPAASSSRAEDPPRSRPTASSSMRRDSAPRPRSSPTGSTGPPSSGADLGELDLDSPSLIGAAGSPTLDLAFAAMCLDQVLDHATWLRSSLLEAAERYGATERFVDGLWQLAAFGGATWLGLHAPLLVAGGLLAAGGAWAGSTVWRAAGWGSTPLGAWLDEHRTVLSDPDFVRLVRATVDHVDETVAAAAHVPLAGLLGLPVRAPESASVVLGLAGALGALGVAGGRVLVDGPVRVTRLDRATAAARRPRAPAPSGRRPARASGRGRRAARRRRRTAGRHRRPRRPRAEGRHRGAGPHRAIRHRRRPALDRLRRRHGRLRAHRRRAAGRHDEQHPRDRRRLAASMPCASPEPRRPPASAPCAWP